MTMISWDETLRVGVREIDDQHQKLIDLINMFDEALAGNLGRPGFAKLLNDLIQYTKFHFGTEERLMNQYLYLDRVAHIEGHHHLVHQLVTFRDEFNDGRSEVTTETLSFLKEWLLDHIRHSDKEMAAYLNSRSLR